LINYTVVRKFRQKHTYIHVKSDASIEITTSLTTSTKAIENFVKRKSDWIKKKQALFREKKSIGHESFYLFGTIYKKDDYKISSEKELDNLYRKKSEEMIEPLVKKWSQKMQLFPTHVGYRKNKTRWGSCSAKNRLNFNTNLAKMHPDFIEYVVVHELAHIKHKNHSKVFWNEVEKFLPNYKKCKNLIV
jgi:predicted metal-dependent hydrolase